MTFLSCDTNEYSIAFHNKAIRKNKTCTRCNSSHRIANAYALSI